MPFGAAVLGAALFITASFAHMSLDYPAAFNASNNPHRTTAADPYLEYPYNCCGEQDRWSYPCRGYEKLLGTPDGAPTATWMVGAMASWNISGIGNHFGGSCQVGFSTDGGSSFHVVTSYEGNCPHRDNGNGPDGQDFEFTVPSDLEPGVQIFAWIWYNRERELNMNCAAVNITSSTGPASQVTPSPSTYGTSTRYETANGCTCECESPSDISTCTCTGCSTASAKHDSSVPVAFHDRPLMFVADNGNDCVTPHTTAELKFPEPGPDVVQGDGAYPLELPSGSCGQGAMLAKQAYAG